jgi:hypothetical protein
MALLLLLLMLYCCWPTAGRFAELLARSTADLALVALSRLAEFSIEAESD